MTSTILGRIIIFILGAVTGSFLNVCIYRLPRGESVVKPRSHCPDCKNPISPSDNIPIISYIMLRGKCRACGKKISLRYPLIELITALLFLALSFKFAGPELLGYAIFCSALLVASAVDLSTQTIPDEISVYGAAAGLLFSFAIPSVQGLDSRPGALGYSFIGAATGAVLTYGIGLLGKLMFKKEAMGFGDVKLMAMIGAFLGFKKAIASFFLAPYFGIIFAIIARLKYKKEYVPYGPFLSAGAITALFIFDKIF